jgi:hypothetical protein
MLSTIDSNYKSRHTLEGQIQRLESKSIKPGSIVMKNHFNKDDEVKIKNNIKWYAKKVFGKDVVTESLINFVYDQVVDPDWYVEITYSI